MNIDWNPVVHILDELSEGPHSFLELSYLSRHYEGTAFLDSLLFLAERKLIEVSEKHERPVAVPTKEWPQRFREAFGVEAAAPELMTRTLIDLTGEGGQVLLLLNIGHPPFSRSEIGS
jgi:intein/homing endonuclease